MAETQSPNPTMGQKNRSTVASRLQSPTSPFFLGSNDDCLERAQARAARAAAIRRKSVAVNAAPPPTPLAESDQCLGKEQILELFQNCIKLASENKINQKNTWELNLIDHLCDIIKVEDEDIETNFQKASCTLEAGVKIYSLRVDSVHSEAYKVLGGINRAGHENDHDNIAEDVDGKSRGEKGSSKELEKVSPTSTLESSFEALNVKKFDVAFAVDPLYHQTSAQFDEGGAKGLLLNNLGVYDSCRVLFDSFEIPGKSSSSTAQLDRDDLIDITFAREYVEQMVFNMRMKDEISPTLRTIVNQFVDDNQRPEVNEFYDHNQRQPEEVFSLSHRSTEQGEAACHDAAEHERDTYDTYATWNFEHDDPGISDDNQTAADVIHSELHEGNEDYSFHDLNIDDRFEKVDGFLFLSLGFNSNQNAWAGPDHWKYRKAKGPEEGPGAGNGSPLATKRVRAKKKAEVDIDFVAALNTDFSDVFVSPKNPKSLLLPANRAACNIKLPEDCHYQPEDLVKLFLLPDIMCLGKRQRKLADLALEQNADYDALPSWDDENVSDGPFDNGNLHSDLEDSGSLVSQPRQVSKVEVQYDKTSKIVDVQALKEVLWERMRPSSSASQGEAEVVSFRNLLVSFPRDCGAARNIEDISTHLCFICLLHLANEHGLSIHGSENLDDLTIHLHPSTDVTATK